MSMPNQSRLARPPKISVELENSATLRISQEQHLLMRRYCLAADTNMASATAFILDEFFKVYQLATGKPLQETDRPSKISVGPDNTSTLRISHKQHLLLRAYCLDTNTNIASATAYILDEFFKFYQLASGRSLMTSDVAAVSRSLDSRQG